MCDAWCHFGSVEEEVLEDFERGSKDTGGRRSERQTRLWFTGDTLFVFRWAPRHTVFAFLVTYWHLSRPDARAVSVPKRRARIQCMEVNGRTFLLPLLNEASSDRRGDAQLVPRGSVGDVSEGPPAKRVWAKRTLRARDPARVSGEAGRVRSRWVWVPGARVAGDRRRRSLHRAQGRASRARMDGQKVVCWGSGLGPECPDPPPPSSGPPPVCGKGFRGHRGLDERRDRCRAVRGSFTFPH